MAILDKGHSPKFFFPLAIYSRGVAGMAAEDETPWPAEVVADEEAETPWLDPEDLRMNAEVEQRLAQIANESWQGTLQVGDENDSEKATSVVDTDEEETESALKKMQDLAKKNVRPRSSLFEQVMDVSSKKLKTKLGQPLVMPWEMGFAGMVLGNNLPMKTEGCFDFSVAEKLKEEVVVVEGDEDDPPVVGLDRFPMASQKVRLPMLEEEKEERFGEMQRWLVIAQAMGRSSPMAKMLDEHGEKVLEDILAKKKTGALRTRSVAVLLYLRWANAKKLKAFPLEVETVYKYVDELRRNKAPATRANSFRSALAFMKGTFDLEGVDEILQNSAISGSCHRSYLTKRLLRQRDAVKVDLVRVLENVVELGETLTERVFAGHCLMCIYGRLRFGDSQGIEKEPVIEGEYLEAGTTMHKTDSMVGRARRMLPVAAPAVGVSMSNWARAFVVARRDAGLRAGVGRPFMPAPIIGGGWSPGRLRTSEASTWLCELLSKYSLGEVNVSNIGAHSMKATCLSWMAKAGMAEKTRRLLGYHVKPKDKSLIVYSRDALAGPLYQLSELILKIASGEFKPDETRSGRWDTAEGAEDGYEDDADDNQCLEVDSPKWDTTEAGGLHRLVSFSNMTDSSTEESDEESEGGEAERVTEKVVVSYVGPPKKVGEGLYRHSLSGIIHVGSTVEGFLACGRKISPMMKELSEEVHGLGSKCKVCTGYQRWPLEVRPKGSDGQNAGSP